MSEMWQGVLIGALVAIPISILANFIYKWMDRKFSDRSQRAIDRHKAAVDAFERTAIRYANSDSAYSTHLRESFVLLANRAIKGSFLVAFGLTVDMLVSQLIGGIAGQAASLAVIAIYWTAGWQFLNAINALEGLVRTVTRVRQLRDEESLSSPPVPSISNTQTPAIQSNGREQAPGSGTDETPSPGAPSSNAHSDPQQPSGPPPAS